MARPNCAPELYKYGVVEVEYKRIPCRYAGYNIVFKVKEHSKYPDYLAVVLLYQAGQYDVTAVDIWQEDCKQWRGMRRAYGAVFDVVTPPKGQLRVRFQLVSSVETTWVESKTAIPGEWKVGATYPNITIRRFSLHAYSNSLFLASAQFTEGQYGLSLSMRRNYELDL
ncbi:unnamed protein product [Linum tenue]|uniref:Expansin-like CBD domain-containing protein n=1 Tax=Linum tenue TaxID=586396 RepID=A0AAV0Q356_9ROSI|nr:unnamed protein product [Linum tenue]